MRVWGEQRSPRLPVGGQTRSSRVQSKLPCGDSKGTQPMCICMIDGPADSMFHGLFLLSTASDYAIRSPLPQLQTRQMQRSESKPTQNKQTPVQTHLTIHSDPNKSTSPPGHPTRTCIKDESHDEFTMKHTSHR